MIRFASYLYQFHKNKTTYYLLLLGGSFCICLWLNTGGLFENKYTQTMYYNFYRHSQGDAYLKNIEIYGKKPLGF